MSEVKTKTFCAPCHGGPLHGRIFMRPAHIDEFLWQVTTIGTGLKTTHRYLLLLTINPEQADGYYGKFWAYQGPGREQA